MNLQDVLDTATVRVLAAGKVLADAVRTGTPLDAQVCRSQFDDAWAEYQAARDEWQMWKDAQ